MSLTVPGPGSNPNLPDDESGQLEIRKSFIMPSASRLMLDAGVEEPTGDMEFEIIQYKNGRTDR